MMSCIYRTAAVTGILGIPPAGLRLSVATIHAAALSYLAALLIASVLWLRCGTQLDTLRSFVLAATLSAAAGFVGGVGARALWTVPAAIHTLHVEHPALPTLAIICMTHQHLSLARCAYGLFFAGIAGSPGMIFAGWSYGQKKLQLSARQRKL
ncbi:MAG: hypothetical protein OWS74_08835 [Firmicutes bacterium]|nr:hypothetical protein [Bacillota bacterium]